MHKNEHFYQRLNKGPSVLFLGQNHLRIETGCDMFLELILRKYLDNVNEYTKANYSNFLEINSQEYDDESVLAWVQQNCLVPVPSELITVAKYPWSDLYTSAIDHLWEEVFKTEWREINKIFEESYKLTEIRNRNNLCCTYLFGCVNQAGKNEKPPQSKAELLKRKQVAISLLRRISEMLTPIGVFVIEGYAGDDDWIKIEDIFPIIDDQIGNYQTHIFSVEDNLAQNELIQLLVQNEKVVLYKESLATVLQLGEKAGLIDYSSRLDSSNLGKKIFINGSLRTIENTLWNTVSRSAIIIDEKKIKPNLNKEQDIYETFRNFLLNSSVRPCWDAYEKGVVFTRDFEGELTNLVDNTLRRSAILSKPIILHGQTGTGKTIALGKLAIDLANHKTNNKFNNYAVLFIERKPDKPNFSDIEAYCNWTENCGAKATIIIWDGMLDIESYERLNSYLVNKGKNALVIGSSYTQPKRILNSILAPSQLTSNEVERFTKYLENIEPALLKYVSQIRFTNDSFLSTLYRILPETRSVLRVGLQKETNYATQSLLNAYDSWDEEFDSPIGYALNAAFQKAKEDVSKIFELTKDNRVESKTYEELDNLIGLITVPGRFGLIVPMELIGRVVKRNIYGKYLEVLKNIDLFRVIEDESGRIWVGARNSLEARLIVQAKFGGVRSEVDFIAQLLKDFKISDWVESGSEMEFIIELLRAIGPNGNEAEYFTPYFGEIANILTEYRVKRGVRQPRIMFQEAIFLRETAKNRNGNTLTPEELIQKETTLEIVETILRESLKIVERENRSSGLRAQILVQLAAALGGKIKLAQTQVSNSMELLPLYKDIRNYIYSSRLADPQNLHAIDTFSWIAISLAEANTLSEEVLAEIGADVFNLYEMVDEDDISLNEQVDFNSRKMQVAALFNRKEIYDNSFDHLASIGSCAGYYIKAINISGLYSKNKSGSFTESDLDSIFQGFQFLNQYRQEIKNDGRCMYLLLKLWWLFKAKAKMFEGERMTLPFGEEDWKYCLNMIIEIMNADSSYYGPRVKYFHGIALFHLNRIDESLQVFKDLETSSDGVYIKNRIIRSYLVGDENGLPKKFSGSVSNISQDKQKGTIYVESLRRKIKFFPKEFGDLRVRQTIKEFHIGFNFINPVADPVHFHSKMANR